MIILILSLILIFVLTILIFNKYLKDKFCINKNIKVCVIIFGFAPRSFKYTHESIENNIINILNKKFNTVDIYHHSLLTKNNIFNTYRDGEKNIIIDNNDVYLLKCKKIVTEYQEDIDMPNFLKCKMYKGYNIGKNEYNYDVIKNSYRAIYSEYRCIKEFPIYNYDVCIMLSSDSLIKKKININEILNVYNQNVIYTTKFNKANGFIANGFYISKPNILNILCNRIKLFNKYCDKIKNAEHFLDQIIKNNKIKNKDSDMFYWKIRANGDPNWYKNINF